MELEPRNEPDRLRVSDREREQIVELLGQATTEGRLTLDEYTERVGAAHAAQTRGELARVTDDLPVAAAPLPVQRPGAAPVSTAQERLVAVFGNETRKGHWIVPAHLEARSVFGDCHLEMQEAQLQAQVTTIDATAVFGSVTIFVPEGVEVRMSGRAVFGSKESKLRGTPPPGAPVLDVRCNVVFGSVTVRLPKRRWFSD
ncbi:DUF1707 SHOCT-like domain-containing protein [Asanoa siamensis]|uniref:Cell wall-active antibiotic response 4TMS protein YvqF n=1 Tax=Asanoa siamensis TaxID=926357 RepID=A0ABQ4CXA8_9ACTN|nr:DUF1707 domain-containing protein [Asanoa siamensis]GIF75918.1 hypothetical protein Asi02nite_54360 [Asanoa siamensis]